MAQLSGLAPTACPCYKEVVPAAHRYVSGVVPEGARGAMTRQPDYYLILGVAPDASPQEIARAYRSLVRRRHPDSRPEGDQQMGLADIYDAYAVLRDPARRADYDGAQADSAGSPRTPSAQPARGRPVPVRVRVRWDDPVVARPESPVQTRPAAHAGTREHPVQAQADAHRGTRQADPAAPGEDESAPRPTGTPGRHPTSPTIWVGPTVMHGPHGLLRPPSPSAAGRPDLIELLRELRRRPL